MNSRWIHKVATVLVAVAFSFALAGAPGCSHCGRCKEPCAKNCPPGCTKPCCAKAATSTTTTTTEVKTQK